MIAQFGECRASIRPHGTPTWETFVNKVLECAALGVGTRCGSRLKEAGRPASALDCEAITSNAVAFRRTVRFSPAEAGHYVRED